MLIRCGADRSVRNVKGDTALHVAARSGSWKDSHVRADFDRVVWPGPVVFVGSSKCSPRPCVRACCVLGGNGAV